MENTFNYNGIPLVVGHGLNELPYLKVPDAQSGLIRKISVSELRIGFSGAIRARITDELLNAQDEVIERASLPSYEETMTPEDYSYFYSIQVSNQSYGEFTSKQLINRLLKDIFGINCYNHLGEFLQPLSFTESHSASDITITLVDYDDTLDVEYSFDGGETWQSSNVLADPVAGEYDLAIRYTSKELREGKSFRSIQNTIVVIE